MREDIRKTLAAMCEEDYKAFSESLIPGADHILGIRLPRLRAYAKELAYDQGESALEGEEDLYFEEVMIRGMIIGYLRVTPERRLELISDFVPRINNWSVCDSFCVTLKFRKSDKPLLRSFIGRYIESEKEFEQRFAAVMLMDHFICDEYIESTLSDLCRIGSQAYYSSMGIAWAAAECFIKYPDLTMPFIRERRFDSMVQKRMIGKICDSYRVGDEVKAVLKAL